VEIFKVDAMRMLVKALCICSCGMVLMMHVRRFGYTYDELVTARAIIGREGSDWRVAFSQPRYLARC
jgi:hypothetical protein